LTIKFTSSTYSYSQHDTHTVLAARAVRSLDLLTA